MPTTTCCRVSKMPRDEWRSFSKPAARRSITYSYKVSLQWQQDSKSKLHYTDNQGRLKARANWVWAQGLGLRGDLDSPLNSNVNSGCLTRQVFNGSKTQSQDSIIPTTRDVLRHGPTGFGLRASA
ncbi:hypothetical protein TNCV_1478091 [Trichonephila clavipes]|nr:hypothetical protein TNCV_1478091 [Trichonephila clavipes]